MSEMIGTIVRKPASKSLLSLCILVFCALLVPLLGPAQRALAATASDDFNRANGALGANWTSTSDGGLTINSQVAAGATSGAPSGSIWSAGTFTSNQFSQIEVTSTQLTGGQWIAAVVRAQNSGKNGYAGLYFWNNGSPVMMIFKRTNGNWTQLGSTYNSGALAAGTQLQLKAAGATISLLQNGVQRISVTDSTYAGGSPGVMAYGTGRTDNWAGGDVAATPTFSVGGSVSGLSGTVVLADNGADNLTLTANGPFTFATKLASGAAYAVTVKTQPPGQTCTVASGSGTMGSANVTNVAVTCTNNAPSTFSVGGTVSGLSGTVVVQDNGGDDLTVSANGPFTFATKLATGAAYAVTVKTQPPGQTCTVANGSGTVGSVNVTTVTVTCASGVGASDNFNRPNGALGANWTNISDGGLTVSSQVAAGTNGGGLTGSTWTATTFGSDQYSQIEVTSTQLTGGQWIAGVVRTTANGQSGYAGLYFWNNGSPVMMIFKRSSGSWTQLGASYNSGALAAGTQLQLKAVGSTISFLQNGVQRISVTDSSFTAGAPGIMAYGTGKADNWAGGSPGGGGGGGTFTVGGSVSGLAGAVVLADNGADNLTLTTSGPFTFVTGLSTGSAYNVTVKTQPPGQTCTVASGSGTIGSANVTNVAVTCTNTTTYSVGGTVSGLTGTVVLADNGTDNLTLSANGPFSFATTLAGGSGYSVTVRTNPTGQTCAVASGSGTIGSANVTNVTVTCTNTTTTTGASDDFNRADGSLGGNWTNVGDGGLAISSQAAAGTVGAAVSGDIRTGETYAGNQYSQIEVTATQLSGSQWIGAAVRVQNGGQDGYVGIYNWNNGSPVLGLYERSGGSWFQLGSYSSGPLAAGTQLKLMVVGSTIAFLANGVERIAVGDSGLTGGAPGIFVSGTAKADNWAGGTAGFEAHLLGTDANGVTTYDMISANDGYGPQVLRVLKPTNPAAGVPHSFLYVLPVEPGQSATFGDGMNVMRGLDAQNKYNLTIVEPSFAIDSWYADNPADPQLHYESFMVGDLVPWVQANLSTTGSEQNWLIGFSKSGIGGQDLILRHPGVFTLAASWDFPADMSNYAQYGSSSASSYGTDANFQANYRLTQAFVNAHKSPFVTSNRIWIGGYSAFQTDDTDYDQLLTSLGIAHTTETPTPMAHAWDSGWVPIALAALRQDSANLP
jgi:hypothetical protein